MPQFVVLKGAVTEILFHERQRIYTLSARTIKDEQILYRLQEALKKQQPVKVGLNLRRGEIERTSEPSVKELEILVRERLPLEKPQKIVPIKREKIDPITFNLADLYLKWPVFKLCEKIVPNYAKAKEIFDFCAKLSCHLAGPPAEPPCIPFQYVRDGSYARAHQMRRIILKRWGYCVEKVFSFATANNDKLAVKADKWGGCCVTWWYHVAPLLRVRLQLKLPISLPQRHHHHNHSRRVKSHQTAPANRMASGPE